MRNESRRYACHMNGRSLSRVERLPEIALRDNRPQTGFALIDDTAGDNDSPAADVRDAFLAGLRDGSIILKSKDHDSAAREARIVAMMLMEEQRMSELPLRALIVD